MYYWVLLPIFTNICVRVLLNMVCIPIPYRQHFLKRVNVVYKTARRIFTFSYRHVHLYVTGLYLGRRRVEGAINGNGGLGWIAAD